MDEKNIKLNNNLNIPTIGLGTYLLKPLEAYSSVISAIKCGYKLIDTANIYINEKSVGRAILDSEVKRENIFLSTKLWVTEYENNNAIKETLARLNTNYIDLLFLHQPAGNWRHAYKNIIEAYKNGIVKSIGISNFEGKYLDELLSEFDVIPQVIQVECHPLYPQVELIKQIQNKNIKIMSWYPLGGKGMTEELINNPIIINLSKKYNKSSVQIILRWHIQMGFITIPGSKNENHIKENISIYDFKLNDNDMNEIKKICNNKKRHIRTEENLKKYESYFPNYEK